MTVVLSLRYVHIRYVQYTARIYIGTLPAEYCDYGCAPNQRGKQCLRSIIRHCRRLSEVSTYRLHHWIAIATVEPAHRYRFRAVDAAAFPATREKS